jgi:hypothetical protein
MRGALTVTDADATERRPSAPAPTASGRLEDGSLVPLGPLGCLPAAPCLFGFEAGKQPPCRCRPGKHRVLTEMPTQCACFVVTQADNRCTLLGVAAFHVTAYSRPPSKSPSARPSEKVLVGAIVLHPGREAATRVVGRDDVDALPKRGRKRADRDPSRCRCHSD